MKILNLIIECAKSATNWFSIQFNDKFDLLTLQLNVKLVIKNITYCQIGLWKLQQNDLTNLTAKSIYCVLLLSKD